MTPSSLIVLGVESSCDDTAAAVVRGGREILSNCVSGQEEFHRRFAGVVPEIASRRHLEVVHCIIRQAMDEAGVGPADIDRIAVTNRPGLVGSLLVGVSAAKALAWAWDKPLVPVNHIAAHLYAPAFETSFSYPVLGLAVSGGHTLLAVVQAPDEIEIVGSTIDDAAGEVFDKIAKHFGLGYPGGPVIDRLAKEGDPAAYAFPRTQLDPERQRYDFSFSGIKTAVIHQRARFLRQEASPAESLPDIAASFQEAVAATLLARTRTLAADTGITTVVVSGGVAANSAVRAAFAAAPEIRAIFPGLKLCMDNAAMVAGVGACAREVLTGRMRNTLEVSSRIVLRGRRRGGADEDAALYRPAYKGQP